MKKIIMVGLVIAGILGGVQARDDGGMAFPVAYREVNSFERYSGNSGMTLRDYFAAQAMVGLLLHKTVKEKFDADYAYALADAMIVARNK